MIIYRNLPIDIQKKIDNYLYNTTFDNNYVKNSNKIVLSELKMNFCFNCRGFLEYKNKKTIPKKFVNSWNNILNNIMNECCILEKDIIMKKENYIDLFENNIIINHWQMKDIITKKFLIKENKKFIKVHRIYNKYISYNIKNHLDQI